MVVVVCVYVCVFFPFILDIKFVGRTSRGHTGGRSHRIFHPPSFWGACLNFSREKDSAIPFPRRPPSRILCTDDLIVLHPLGIFFLFFFVFSEKNPVAGIELTSQRVRGLRATGASSTTELRCDHTYIQQSTVFCCFLYVLFTFIFYAVHKQAYYL